MTDTTQHNTTQHNTTQHNTRLPEINYVVWFLNETHPGFHVCEEILHLGEPDLGGGHELLHDGEVPVPAGESLATVELHLSAAFLHASSQLSHVLLQFSHAEMCNSQHSPHVQQIIFWQNWQR